MRGILFCLVICLFLSDPGITQPTAPSHRVLLVSNLADVPADDPYWNQLRQLLEIQSGPYTLLVNGDLISKSFNPSNQGDLLRIDKLINLAQGLSHGRVIILPGDRDWDNSGIEGLKSVKRLEDFVKGKNVSNLIWPLKNGCPGPQEIPLSSSLSLIAINTQWFNHPHGKPLPEDGTCKIPTQEEFMEELEEISEEAQNRNILIAGHFPMYSLGRSAGNYPLGKYMLPIPIISGLPISYHQNVGSSQDITNDRFTGFREDVQNFLRSRNSMIYASGHDADLQILNFNDNYLINSGSSIRARFVAKSKSANYASAEPGLIALNYFDDGKITADILSYSKHGFSPVKPSICCYPVVTTGIRV